ncbi:MAG: hypothetical protein J7K47_04295 [Thermoplasmata archaeon]|nr:hypothetical protein [Thermoplasmata archaeon]
MILNDIVFYKHVYVAPRAVGLYASFEYLNALSFEIVDCRNHFALPFYQTAWLSITARQQKIYGVTIRRVQQLVKEYREKDIIHKQKKTFSSYSFSAFTIFFSTIWTFHFSSPNINWDYGKSLPYSAQQSFYIWAAIIFGGEKNEKDYGDGGCRNVFGRCKQHWITCQCAFIQGNKNDS